MVSRSDCRLASLVLATAMVCACRGTGPEPVEQASPASVQPEAEPKQPTPAPEPAPAEGETRTSTETGTAETETGAAEAEIETGSETEIGSETGAERRIGRLCSKPYSLSSTPGKGASSRASAEDSSATRPKRSFSLTPGLEVGLEGEPRQIWTTKYGVEFDELDASEVYTIAIVEIEGKRVKTMKLDFDARGSDDLCLSYNDFYGTWQLRALRSGQRCGPCTTR